jgi:hypothetical protein
MSWKPGGWASLVRMGEHVILLDGRQDCVGVCLILYSTRRSWTVIFTKISLLHPLSNQRHLFPVNLFQFLNYTDNISTSKFTRVGMVHLSNLLQTSASKLSNTQITSVEWSRLVKPENRTDNSTPGQILQNPPDPLTLQPTPCHTMPCPTVPCRILLPPLLVTTYETKREIATATRRCSTGGVPCS